VKRQVPAKRLTGEPFVMFSRLPGHVFHDQVMGFCLRAGRRRRSGLEGWQAEPSLYNNYKM
jgi:hypothetical protein